MRKDNTCGGQTESVMSINVPVKEKLTIKNITDNKVGKKISFEKIHAPKYLWDPRKRIR